MNGSKKFVVILLLLVLSMQLVPAAAGYESLFFNQKLSRGMTLYFVALAILIAVPFLNRHLKTIIFFFVVFFLSRSFMRITDEQDPVRMIYSLPDGMRLGLLLAMLLVGLSLAIVFLLGALKKVKAVPSPGKGELLHRLNQGKKQGKNLEQIRNELIDEGVKKEDFDDALASMGD